MWFSVVSFSIRSVSVDTDLLSLNTAGPFGGPSFLAVRLLCAARPNEFVIFPGDWAMHHQCLSLAPCQVLAQNEATAVFTSEWISMISMMV